MVLKAAALRPVRTGGWGRADCGQGQGGAGGARPPRTPPAAPSPRGPCASAARQPQRGEGEGTRCRPRPAPAFPAPRAQLPGGDAEGPRYGPAITLLEFGFPSPAAARPAGIQPALSSALLFLHLLYYFILVFLFSELTQPAPSRRRSDSSIAPLPARHRPSLSHHPPQRLLARGARLSSCKRRLLPRQWCKKLVGNHCHVNHLAHTGAVIRHTIYCV